LAILWTIFATHKCAGLRATALYNGLYYVHKKRALFILMYN
jgi:hypothetical protein